MTAAEQTAFAVAEAGVHIEQAASALPLGSWQRRALERAAERLGELSVAIEQDDQDAADAACPG